jgi:type IV fimbrial biogenesis protein FimT
MTTTSKKIYSKAGHPWLNRHSFIGMKAPFVGAIKPSIMPTIGKNTPSVDIQKISGLTLIELMVAVVVVGILLTLAVPSMRTFIQNMRITTQANEFISDLNFARSEAIKRATNVTVCLSNDVTATTPTCSTTGTDWAVGRIITVGTEVLRVREPLQGNNQLNNKNTPTVVKFDFTRTGATDKTGITLDFRLCDSRLAAFGRQISVDTTGRTELSKPPVSCS